MPSDTRTIAEGYQVIIFIKTEPDIETPNALRGKENGYEVFPSPAD